MPKRRDKEEGDVVRMPAEELDRETTVRPAVPGAQQSGAWSEEPGHVRRPATHDTTMVEERDGDFVLHVELPPVDPDEVEVDVTGDQIIVILPQGESRDIYCTMDMPPNVDPTKPQIVKMRGHLEIVLPKLREEA